MHKDEIILSNLFNSLWNEKIKIILITLVLGLAFTIIKYVIILLIPLSDDYKIKKNIKPGNADQYIKFIPINTFISKIKHSNKNEENLLKFDPNEPLIDFPMITKSTVLERFSNELNDHEELFVALSNNPYVKKKISELSNLEKKIALQNYAKSLKFKNTSLGGDITFSWHDFDQANKILNETLILVISNLEKSIFNEYREFLNLCKDWYIKNDLIRVDYLFEQSILAKELNILEPNFKNFDDVNSLTKNNYHLRGSKMIDKEINIIENRNYREITYLLNNLNLLEVKHDIKFINQDFLESQSTKVYKSPRIGNTNEKLIINFLLGLLIAIIFVICKKKLKLRKFLKK